MPSIFRPGLFQKRGVVVTGGGSGIGLAITRLFGELGAKVAIGGRTQERLDVAKAELAARGIGVFTQTCDIRELEQVGAFVDATVKELGPIDILVNNAGGQFPTQAENLAPKGWDAVIR